MLGIYLTSSSAAPLNREFVEIESPLWYDGLFIVTAHHTDHEVNP